MERDEDEANITAKPTIRSKSSNNKLIKILTLQIFDADRLCNKPESVVFYTGFSSKSSKTFSNSLLE